MSYTTTNFKTKKALKQAVANGDKVTIYNPNALVPAPFQGIAYLEGPHYPAAHTWYARVEMLDGYITRVC